MKISMKIISLGLGVQSTALYLMSSTGELPRVDQAIFVDPGREKKKTMEYLEYLMGLSLGITIPLIVVKKKNLFEDLLHQSNSRGKRFSSIPAFSKNEDGTTGMLRRQCTGEYKIEQVDQAIRKQQGLLPRMRGKPAEVWKGISLDEIERLSIPLEKWKTQVYPFCGYSTTHKGPEKLAWSRNMTRNDIINWYHTNGFRVPPKSSCVFCPYTSEAAWLDMKINEPEDFADAVRVDYAIRDASKKGCKAPLFLHQSCKPLDQVVFETSGNDLWKGECSGECHT